MFDGVVCSRRSVAMTVTGVGAALPLVTTREPVTTISSTWAWAWAWAWAAVAKARALTPASSAPLN
jgi:hypothetical protein